MFIIAIQLVMLVPKYLATIVFPLFTQMGKSWKLNHSAFSFHYSTFEADHRLFLKTCESCLKTNDFRKWVEWFCMAHSFDDVKMGCMISSWYTTQNLYKSCVIISFLDNLVENAMQWLDIYSSSCVPILVVTLCILEAFLLNRWFFS